MLTEFTVLCINDNWRGLDKKKAPGPSFMDTEVVTDIEENEHGTFYQLKGYNPSAGFSAKSFVIPGELSENEIMPRDEVCNHLIDMVERRERESMERYKKTKTILAGLGILGLISGFFLFKK